MSRPRRRIDHLVLAVHDLDGAARLCTRLGFQVGARNQHPWGTENHIIQLRSSFLELIGVADADRLPPHRPGHFSFGRFVGDYLQQREGLAMVVLDSIDARADADLFQRTGLGDFDPFSFERDGRAADGTTTRVAFTLAFATDDRMPDAGFFTCQQHVPDAFWSPALQRHPNGAQNVVDVVLDVTDPADYADFLAAFTGVTCEGGQRFPLAAGGALSLTSTSGTGRLTAFTVAVPSVDAVGAGLRAHGVPHQRSDDQVVVTAEDGLGVQIIFDQSATG